MAKDDTNTTVDELRKLPLDFCEQRGWLQNQTPRGLAISITLETAELLEHFQWEEYNQQDKQEVADELADILIYCLELSHHLDVDITSTIQKKLLKVAKKYPVETIRNNPSLAKYKHLKQEYRKGKK